MATISAADTTALCAWAGVLETDTTAKSTLLLCYDKAWDFYKRADCDMNDKGIKTWLFDAAAWFYDHRGASAEQLPHYIAVSVNSFRKAVDPREIL